MECRDVKNMLSEYIDGVLSDDAAASVKAHLDECGGCTETYEEMTRLIGYMRDTETVDEPADLLDNVKARLETPASPAAWLRRLFTPAPISIPVAATVIVVVAMLVFYLPGVRDGGDLIEAPISKDTAISEAPSVEKKRDKKEPAPPRAEKMESTADDEVVVDAPAPEVAPAPGDVAASQEVASTEEVPSAEEVRASGEARDLDEVRSFESASASKAAPTPKEVSIEGGVSTSEDVSIPDIILALGGTLVNQEFGEAGRRQATLVVELPVDSIPSLLKKLEELGWTAGELPEETLSRKGKVTIKINKR
jgi:anti-sigma factor RsiW